MADLETIHRIEERIEVKGAPQLEAAFRKLAGASDAVADALGHTRTSGDQLAFAFAKVESAAKKTDNAVRKPKLPEWFRKSKEAAEGFFKTMAGQFTIANVISRVFDAVYSRAKGLVTEAWRLNDAFEFARQRVSGMALGLAKFEEGASSIERLERSTRVANVMMEEFEDIAYRTATPSEKIAEVFASVNPVMMQMGLSARDVRDATMRAAAAAKVFGVDAGEAGRMVAKAFATGTIEGDGAFAQALKLEAKINSKMPLEERMKRINRVLDKMGAPIDVATQGTRDMAARWDVLANGVLRGMVQPAYEKIGEVLGGFVGYLKDNESALKVIVSEAEFWWRTVFAVGGAIWDAAVAAAALVKLGGDLGSGFSVAYNTIKLIAQIVDIAATGIGALIAVISGDDKGFGKLLAISTAIEVKWREIALTILSVARGLGNLAIPGWVRNKIPGLESFSKGFDEVEKSLKTGLDASAAHLRRLERNEGLSPMTSSTKLLEDLEKGKGLSPFDKEALLASMKGLKIQQNIDKIEIKQDFRDGDPDRVLVEFVTSLERIGQEALQSNAGGLATAFEG